MVCTIFSYLRCEKSSLKVALPWNMFCFIPFASATQIKREITLTIVCTGFLTFRSYIGYLLTFFQILSYLPPSLTQHLFLCLVSLSSQCTNSLNDADNFLIIGLHLSSLNILVPEVPFYLVHVLRFLVDLSFASTLI